MLGVQEKSNNLDSRSYSTPRRSVEFLATNSLLHGVPWHPLIPAASIASCRLTLTAPSNQPGFGKIIAINRNTYGTTNRLSALESDVQVHRLPKNTLQSQIPSGIQTKTPPQSNARHPPRNGQARRRPVQPPEFALILFVRPSFARSCCTWRMSGLMSSS